MQNMWSTVHNTGR